MTIHLPRRLRAGLVAAVSAAVVVAAGLVGFAQPAAAVPQSNGTFRTLTPSKAFYIDQRDVNAQLGAGSADLPVGAWQDAAGKHHMARALLTFDVSALRAMKIFSANIVTAETSVNHCPSRAIDLWTTDDPTATTSWARPPAERSLIGSVTGASPAACPASYMEWDGTRALQSAVDAGASTLTVEFRVPEAHEGDVAFGRRLTSLVHIYLRSDSAPNTPSRLASSSTGGCVTQAPYPYAATRGQMALSATGTDPDLSDNLDLHFAIWPVDHPDQRTEMVYQSMPSGNTGQVQVPPGYLADGVSYAWAVRSDDGIFLSDWAGPCYFTVDMVPPAPPTVSSTDYPADLATHGGAGIPGLFTFGANGSSDVVRYVYGWNSEATQSVNTPTLGADVTISLAPPRGGINQLMVVSVDRAGFVSNTTEYLIIVGETAPSVTIVWPVPHPASGIEINPGPGMSGTVTFLPTMTDVVSYEYWTDAGDHQTLAAAADGSAQTAISAPNALGFHTLHARSVTAAGVTSGITDEFYVVDDVPLVASSEYPEMDAGGGTGITGTFTFAPKSTGVVGYVYSFNFGDTLTVAADADGTAAVQFTPDYDGFQIVSVQARYADGRYSQEYDYYFNVGPF